LSRAATGQRRKHWGWGYEDRQPGREELAVAARGIRERLGFRVEQIEEPVPLDAIELRAPRVEAPASLSHLFRLDPYDRVSHALGKTYRDVVRGFRGEIENPPDLVAHPSNEPELEAMLAWCSEEGIAAIPYGGGTSVVGGVEPRVDEAYRAAVTIDLGRLDRVLEVDPVSRAARIQAGAAGPRLEDELRGHGHTLRHFPQSFEFSTLGGWIATRAGGHFATLYTHIDDLVESVRALTPRGAWESFRLPGSGAGPSPDRLLLGSEGSLGVITEAWVRVQERPRFKLSVGVAFDSFEDGAEAVRELAQSGLNPSNCRLLDAAESEVRSAGPAGKALLVLGFESAHHPVEASMEIALEATRDHGGERGEIRGTSNEEREPDPKPRQGSLRNNPPVRGEAGSDPVGSWRHAFLAAPYLRDTFVACGVLSDTFETAITWDRFPDFHASVTDVARRAVAEACGAPPDGPGLASPFLPLHPRLSRRTGALLHGACRGPTWRRGRAVERDQGSGLGDRDRRRRNDHAPPRHRARPPPMV